MHDEPKDRQTNDSPACIYQVWQAEAAFLAQESRLHADLTQHTRLTVRSYRPKSRFFGQEQRFDPQQRGFLLLPTRIPDEPDLC